MKRITLSSTKKEIAWKIVELENLIAGGKVFQYRDFRASHPKVEIFMREKREILEYIYAGLQDKYLRKLKNDMDEINS